MPNNSWGAAREGGGSSAAGADLRADGTIPLAAPLNAAANQIKNLAAATDPNDAVTLAQLQSLLSTLGTTEFSAGDIAVRNALTTGTGTAATDLSQGDRVFVADATADASVASGWAIYRYRGAGTSGAFTDGDFDKIAEQESLDINFPAATLSLSTSPKNVLSLDADGDLFYSPDVLYQNVVAEISNGAGASIGPIQTIWTPATTVDAIVHYSGQVTLGTGGISIGTTSGGSEVFVASPSTGDADGSRLSVTRQENFTPQITFTGGTTYYFSQWAGGGGLVIDHTVCVEQVGTSTGVTGPLVIANEVYSFVENRCYEEPGAPYDNDILLPYLDEIVQTQLDTLPTGAHMRWTAPIDIVLNILEVARLGAATSTTISWETSNGVSGSVTTTTASANTPINLGGVSLSAGDTIDFTLDDITGGQMQLAVEATSIAAGWTALQDYSGFATTSHWSTRLIGEEPGILHEANAYSNGTVEELRDPTDITQVIDPTGWDLLDKGPMVVTEKFVATAANSSGQPAGNGLFYIQSGSQTEGSQFDAISRYSESLGILTVNAPADFDVKVTANFITTGTGNVSRIYFFRNLLEAAGAVYGTSGIFGQGSAQTPATAIVPAGTSVRLQVRSASSANNQVLQPGSFICAETIGSTDDTLSAVLTMADEKVDACGINEFIHNIKDYKLVFSHENDATLIRSSVNGAPSTYENLLNTTDNGDGSITFAGGGNGNYNKRANTVESIRECDEYFEIVVLPEGSFDTVFVAITDDVTNNAEAAGNHYRFRFAGGGYSLFDTENQVVSTGTAEQGTYRVVRSLSGFVFYRNEEEIHRTPSKCIDYTNATPEVLPLAQGVYSQAAPDWVGPTVEIAVGTNAIVATGVDLTQVDYVVVHYTRGGGTWPQNSRFDIADILLGAVQGYMGLHYSDDFVSPYNVTTAELAAGDLRLSANGQAFDIRRIEFRKKVDTGGSSTGGSIAVTEVTIPAGATAIYTGTPVSTEVLIEDVDTIELTPRFRDVNIVVNAFEDAPFTLELSTVLCPAGAEIIAGCAVHLSGATPDSANHKPSLYIANGNQLVLNRDDTDQAGATRMGIQARVRMP